ncbi:MAG: TetR/AcrR family transcriptional regulator [Alphaproteobacteria bacterium]|nr:TetR/AcrR family transcriptional regulator [Alphaproteobacteria bacterium]
MRSVTVTVPSTADARTERRRQILDAAVRVFAARGYHDTRIQDVADEAGVAYGLVYHYFGTKDRLLSTVYDDNWAVFAEVVEGIAASGRSPWDQVRAVLDYVFGALEAYPERMRVILVEYGRLAGTAQGSAHPDVARVIATLGRAFARAERAGALVAGADPAVLPVMVLGALQAAIVALLDETAAPADLPTVRATVLSLLQGVVHAPSTAVPREA